MDTLGDCYWRRHCWMAVLQLQDVCGLGNALGSAATELGGLPVARGLKQAVALWKWSFCLTGGSNVSRSQKGEMKSGQIGEARS